jgi:hypothetical protein
MKAIGDFFFPPFRQRLRIAWRSTLNKIKMPVKTLKELLRVFTGNILQVILQRRHANYPPNRIFGSSYPPNTAKSRFV